MNFFKRDQWEKQKWRFSCTAFHLHSRFSLFSFLDSRNKMRASLSPRRRRAPVPPGIGIVLATLVAFACSRLRRVSAAEGPGEGGAAANSNSSPSAPFFDARLAASAAALGASLGEAMKKPEELDLARLGKSLDLRVFCEPDRFLPAKRMPAIVSLPRLVARIEGGSCRGRGFRPGGGGPGPADGRNSTSPSVLGGLASCSPGRTSWYCGEPLILPERETPAALFAGSCSLSLFPTSLKIKEAAAAAAAAAAEAATAEAATNNGGGGIDDDFTAAPPLSASNARRIQVLSPAVVLRCKSLEALERGECSGVERPSSRPRAEKEKERKKKKSRRAKEAPAVAAAGKDPVLPSAGAIAAEVGREVFEALRAF